MANESPLGATAAAVYAALNVASMTAIATGGVYDFVPQGTAFPYIWIRLSSRSDDYLGGHAGFQMRLAVHGFSAYEGGKEVREMMEEARQLLRHAIPSITGFTSLLIEHEGTVERPYEEEDDIRVSHSIATFLVTVEE
jgi:hypothetical protein